MPNSPTCQGTATLWSTLDDFAGPEVRQFEFAASLDRAKGAWSVTQFDPIVIEDIDTPVGSSTLTVSLVPPTAGVWQPASGSMAITVTFEFDFSHPLISASTLVVALDTDTAHPAPPQAVQGRRLDGATGRVSITGIGRFIDGDLQDERCAIQLVGTFTPAP